jgi:hypothetical protein
MLQYTVIETAKTNDNLTNVADPDPEGPDVFGPPGSGSISQKYGSGSFYHQKVTVPTVPVPVPQHWLKRDLNF